MRAGRLVTLMLILQGRGRTTASQLAERLEVSERTVLRDIDELLAAGVPILAFRGRGGGFELEETAAFTVAWDPPARSRKRPRRAAIRISAEGRRRAAVLGRIQPLRVRRSVPPDARGWVEATFRVDSFEGAVVDVLSLSPEVEVATPEGLRAEVAARLDRAAQLYRPPATLPAMTHEHAPGEFRFCPMCASELEDRAIGHLVRRACPRCGYVHFRNPATSAAVLVRDGTGRVLMVKRSDAVSRSGYWSLPGGFVDYGEDIRETARRELREEAGIEAEIGAPVFVMTNFHDPEKITVCVWFEASVTGGEPVAGDDAVEVGFFATDDLPPLAFDTDAVLLARLGDEE